MAAATVEEAFAYCEARAKAQAPSLVITAEDDPFVPSPSFRDASITGNAHIDLRLCEHGGHCGFVGPASAEHDGYWAEHQIVEFITGVADAP